jgi:hypothetical protein
MDVEIGVEAHGRRNMGREQKVPDGIAATQLIQ